MDFGAATALGFQTEMVHIIISCRNGAVRTHAAECLLTPDAFRRLENIFKTKNSLRWF